MKDGVAYGAMTESCSGFNIEDAFTHGCEDSAIDRYTQEIISIHDYPSDHVNTSIPYVIKIVRLTQKGFMCATKVVRVLTLTPEQVNKSYNRIKLNK